MKAAVERARQNWPQFVHAFEHRSPGQVFSAKACFRDGQDKEFMWLKVTAIENDVVFGILDNAPGIIRTLKEGQQTSFRLAELNDWLYTDGKKMQGGFTISVFRPRSSGDAPPE
jgi:uncharacterized protein YegJ (DUF2314 family)